MTTLKNLILPVTLMFGLAVPLAAGAQQPAPPPESTESGWRKFGEVRQAEPRQMEAGGAAAEGPRQALAERLVVPAGTWITIRVNDVISTNHNLAGDGFAATLAQPLIAEGIVLARRGQTVAGRVAEVEKGGRIRGTARLGLELTELGLVDGRQVPVRTQLISYAPGTSRGRDAGAVATTTGAGAAIGAMAGGGLGAGVGALAGAAASGIGVLTTRGRTAEVYPEEALTFRLLEPLSVETGNAAAAFRPVSQQDYEPSMAPRTTVRMAPRLPMDWSLGYGYGIPFYSPFLYGPGFGYYGGGLYRGGFYGGRIVRGGFGRGGYVAVPRGGGRRR